MPEMPSVMPDAEARLDAVVFDFDGTILDTETPVYEAWRSVFEDRGVEPISFDDWVQSIGLSARQFDPLLLLEERLGIPLERDAVQEDRRRLRNLGIDALPVRSGVVDWFDEAERRGVPVAIASSSPREWVEPHLASRGLLNRVAFLACAEDPITAGHARALALPGGPVPGKPDPTSYRLACHAVGADPTFAVAVEDSPHGVTAANAAGLYTVATPGPMTAHFDFGHAQLVLDALADRTLAAMAGLIARR